jgi:hypothetical protein
MQRLIEMTIDDWNVAIWSEDDLERRIVGCCSGAKSIQDGRHSEHGNIVDRHNKGADIFATNISDPRGNCVGDDSRNKTVFSDVAFLDIEAEAGMLATDGRGQLVEAIERIVGDLQVE